MVTERIIPDSKPRSLSFRPIVARILTPLLLIGALIAIYIGWSLTLRSGNDGVAILSAILSAIGAAGLIAAAFPRERTSNTTDRIYYVRVGPFIWRAYGDTETDKHFD